MSVFEPNFSEINNAQLCFNIDELVLAHNYLVCKPSVPFQVYHIILLFSLIIYFFFKLPIHHRACTLLNFCCNLQNKSFLLSCLIFVFQSLEYWHMPHPHTLTCLMLGFFPYHISYEILSL